MKLNIAKKLIGSFMIMAVLVLVAGMPGIIMVKKLVRSNDLLVKEKVPFKDVAMEAIIAIERTMDSCRNYLLAVNNFDEIKRGIDENLGKFDLFISMINFGTDSVEFKNSPANEMYTKEGLDIRVVKGNRQMQEKIAAIRKESKVFVDRAGKVMQNHLAGSQYDFTYEDVHYSLAAFLYKTVRENEKWFEKLAASVEYEVDFTGELDPCRSFFGRWYGNSYHIDNPELETMLKNFNEQQVCLHKLGADVMAAPENRRTSLLTRGKRISHKVTKELETIAVYTEKHLAVLKNNEKTCMAEMYQAAKKMNVALNDLKVMADKSMAQAVAGSHETASFSILMVSILVAGSLVLAIVLGFFMTRSITGPLNLTVAMVQDIAEGEGDLTKRLEVKSNNELGELGTGINTFIEKLQDMLRKMIEGIETLASSSTELNTISMVMSGGAENTAGKANNVATAAEEMNANMSSVAAAMEQASTSVSAVASGTEEMNATISEIARNAATAKEVTSQAVTQSKSSAERIDELGQAAQEIGKVTDTINAISSQTNLLALNATIEAARAGEAGKGFAVVAGEIKDLALQTAAATGEIAAKINRIQDSTGTAVIEINEISRINNEVDEIVTAIATAVEEQSSTTSEVAENVAQASQGLSAINENVAQTTEVSGTIARDIAEVNEASNEMSNASTQVQQSAGELSVLAEKLKEMMNKFKV